MKKKKKLYYLRYLKCHLYSVVLVVECLDFGFMDNS